jgi:Uma2 family endonuclease
MAVPKPRLMTADEFERFISQPENAERRWEFIDGEVSEVPSNAYSSAIGALIIAALVAFVKPRGLGTVTGEAAGYKFAGINISPDVAYVSRQKQKTPPIDEQYNPIAPDLIVEVLSPSNKTDRKLQEEMERKIRACTEANVLLWVVDYDPQLVTVYAPGQPIRKQDINDTLTGGDVLPGFTLPIRDIFP